MMSVIINGGGISGAVLALILSKLTYNNLCINLIEVTPIEKQKRSFIFNNSRYIALSRGSYYRLISFFNSPSTLFPYSIPIKQIDVMSSIGSNRVIFSASDYQILSLGYVIELNNLKKRIFSFLRESNAINLFYPSKLIEIKRSRLNNIVVLDNGDEITGQLLIAADGSYSTSATLCGMKWRFFDYHQVAVVANITTSFANEGRSFEVFTSFGSLAVLPISNSRSSLIWCIPISYKKEVSNWNSAEFCRVIQKIFGWELGCILDVDERFFFPLFLRKSDCHISHRLALVGNAAQTLHPVAAQGFNLGFRDVLSISQIISEANMRNIDIGEYDILKLYQISRESDQSRIINMTHGLVYLFNSSYCSCLFFKKCMLSIMEYSSLFRSFLIRTILSW